MAWANSNEIPWPETIQKLVFGLRAAPSGLPVRATGYADSIGSWLTQMTTSNLLKYQIAITKVINITFPSQLSDDHIKATYHFLISVLLSLWIVDNFDLTQCYGMIKLKWNSLTRNNPDARLRPARCCFRCCFRPTPITKAINRSDLHENHREKQSRRSSSACALLLHVV